MEETVARAGPAGIRRFDRPRYDDFALEADGDAVRHIAAGSASAARGPLRTLMTRPPEHVRQWLIDNVEVADG